MKHLDETQLVDALDVAPQPEIGRHLGECADCRAQLDDLRAALAMARSAVPPEPSPLFWDHFLARVTARLDTPVAAEQEVSSGGWLPHALAWGGVLALVLAVVSIMVAPKRRAESPAIASGQIRTMPVESDLDADEAWAMIRDLAQELDYDEVHDAGVAPRPGSVDRAAMELTEAERAELARIIDAELKRIGP